MQKRASIRPMVEVGETKWCSCTTSYGDFNAAPYTVLEVKSRVLTDTIGHHRTSYIYVGSIISIRKTI